MRYDNTLVHTVKRHYNETNDGVEDFNDTQQNTHNNLTATCTDTDYVNVSLKSSLKKIKKKNKKSKMAAKDRGLSKVTAEYKHKNTKKIEFLKNNITEDYSKEMYNDTAMTDTPNNSRNSKVVEEYPLL
ncbi:uncharacterized protein LOC111027652 [Myzus persicae]|uniref:uncharacterized protein LOC111027652 n=1 Tax=Myzus persicae TaxID=13164 RepID=UPI000B934672|nr:uncharacterized protein LOC111027652 [Myzus persicae]